MRCAIADVRLPALAVLASALVSGCGGNGGSPPVPAPSASLPPDPAVQSVRVATDPFANPSSQHATQVEPSAYARGSTIVAAFQDGRFVLFGASGIGFATSFDAGATWTSGALPAATTISQPPGQFDSVSDPSVAYDAAHATWLIASLPVRLDAGAVPVALVSRSADGVHWGDPIAVAPGQPNSDKSWIACDNSASSPHYGNCYLESDDTATGIIRMNVSSDGGFSWSGVRVTLGGATGLGGQPVVRPDGTVVVPIDDFDERRVLAFESRDGGTTWSQPVLVSAITDHAQRAGLRSNPLVAGAIDGAGTVYAVWQDCRFRQGCAANDLVLSSSTDGISWTSPARIPIDSLDSGVDHFIPGLAVDPSSSGSSARIALAYYYYPNTACTVATCALDVGFVQSADGGASWSAPTTLAGPSNVAWLAQTTQGAMVGDYIASVFAGGRPVAVYTIANPRGSGPFDEAIYVPKTGAIPTALGARRTSRGEHAIPGIRSDHAPRRVRPALPLVSNE
jgi:hypothetical protein